MSRWDYGKGLPSVINGTAESEEQLQQQAREVVARKLGIDPRSMVERRDKGSTDLRYAPMIDLKPTEILHKKGEYGHPNFWKNEKEYENYLVKDAIQKKRIKEFRQDPEFVAAHNKRFPNFPTTQLPKQQPQYGVKPINGHDSSTFAYNQKEALATADAMDKAVANTKTRINQIHKNPAAKIAEKQQSIKDLQRITDIAYKYSNDQWEHKPTWKLDRKSGSPVDVEDPNYKNARTVKQLLDLKSWSQGGKVNAPHVKLNSAGNKLRAAPKPKPDAGVRYIPREERIQHHYDTLEAEKAKR